MTKTLDEEKKSAGVQHPELLHQPPPRPDSVWFSWEKINYPGSKEPHRLPEHLKQALRDQYRG